MPNWCDNHISITGPNSVMDKLEKVIQTEEGLLQFMLPMPKELADTTAPFPKDATPEQKAQRIKNLDKYGFDNWYDWRNEHWGTKWDVNEYYGFDRQYINDDESQISVGFSSAWGPPLQAFQEFIDKHPVILEARYYEPGCDFMGIWDNGDDTCYECSKYGSDDDFWKSGDGAILDESFNIVENLIEWEEDQEPKEEVTEYVKGNPVNIGEDK